jgi:hypothetical protein
MTTTRIPLLGFLALLTLSVTACGTTDAPEPLETVVTIEDLRVGIKPTLFTDIREIVPVEGGAWVLDGAPPHVTLLDEAGGIVVQFGEDGSGPEEFRAPWAMQVFGLGDVAQVAIWDLGNARVSTFSTEGALVSTRRIETGTLDGIRLDIRNVTYADPFRVRQSRGRFVYGRYPGTVSQTWDLLRGEVVASSSVELASPMLVAPLTEPVTFSASAELTELRALPLWDACTEGSVLVWRPDLGSLRWVAPDGSTLREREPPFGPRAMTHQDVVGYLRLMARLELGVEPEEKGIDIDAMARSSREYFADWAPLATDLRCGAGEEAWLRLFDTTHDPLGRGSLWITFGDEDLRSLRFPDGFSPFAFEDTGVLGVLEDDLGFQRVARWPTSS